MILTKTAGTRIADNEVSIVSVGVVIVKRTMHKMINQDLIIKTNIRVNSEMDRVIVIILIGSSTAAGSFRMNGRGIRISNKGSSTRKVRFRTSDSGSAEPIAIESRIEAMRM